MDEDNIYPNDSSYFLPREPADQVIARKKERAKTLEGLAPLKALIEHLETRIEFYGSVDAMPDDVKADPAKFLNMHNANQLTRDNLREEKDYIESLLDNAGQTGV